MAKKSFKETNPALQFISAAALPEAPEPVTPVNTLSEPRKSRTGAETKSKRLNLLLQPSVLADLSKIARMQQTSVNDLINTVLRDYREEQVALVMRHDEVFGAK